MKITLILILLIATFTLSRAQNNQVEVKTDRFSGVSTIKLRPQEILNKPEQIISMSLEAEFQKKRSGTLLGMMLETTMVSFDSQAKDVNDFEDNKLVFIADDKRIITVCSQRPVTEYPDTELKSGFKFHDRYICSLKIDKIKQLETAKNIEMSLGPCQFTLSTDFIRNLHEYINEYLKYESSTRR